ncbi:MAG: hypothetical protein OSB03_10125 [Vicinamibacterales bacterium]|nr:hypothetical protein [Vicinamibacterales bacterium]
MAPSDGASRREGLRDVAVPAGGGQLRLRAGGDDTSQRVYHRSLQLGCEFGGLIEAAEPATSCVEWYRYHTVCVREDRCAGLTHQRTECDREGVPSIVLQEMDDLSEGSLVGTDGA